MPQTRSRTKSRRLSSALSERVAESPNSGICPNEGPERHNKSPKISRGSAQSAKKCSLKEQIEQHQKEIANLKKELAKYKADKEKKANEPTPLHDFHAGPQIYDSTSEDDVVHQVRMLNNIVHQSAAHIANSCSFDEELVSSLKTNEVKHSSSVIELVQNLLVVHPEWEDAATNLEHVLQYVLLKCCSITIHAWTSGCDEKVEDFLDQVERYIDASCGKRHNHQ